MATKAPRRSPSRYLIDNSVWARLSTDASVVAAVKSVVDLARPDDVLICPPIALELGFSARTGSDHSALMAQLAAFPECRDHPTNEEAMLIQNRLWNAGLVRSAGAMDSLIAAYAIKNEAVLLHYDRDFDYIASVMPEFHAQWIVPRGSID
ncbi:PIN domain-containing protein [Lacisediminihabitans sp.]|uniref:PIN domain-containing protein n=1 Tax=Lacisediminihabitans sp. TaxID=2787631 RepID=UPI00374DD0D6